MRTNQVRRIGMLLVFWMIFLIAQAAFAHVDGSQGLAPVLPPNVPGVDRPFPQDEEKFTFAIIGDKTGGGQRNWHIFDRAIEEVGYIHPDFAIIVGDLIQGYTTNLDLMDRQWKQFYQHASRIQVPFFFLPGNHDITNKVMYDYWNANVGRTYYSFDYKGCHFILLNTEEGWRNGEVRFGSEQMEWVRADIESHRDSKHIFIFMHRPAWYASGGEERAQWEAIESWLEGLPYTVFAGHLHSLIYEERKDHRYFVLGATGAVLTPMEMEELGEFHHYTFVTVDGQDVHVAITEPGNIHRYDIALREFRKKVSQVIFWRQDFPIVQGTSGGELTASVRNVLEEPLTINFGYSPSDGSSWDFAPRTAQYIIQPGSTTEIAIKASYDFENLLPLPSYEYDISYKGQRLRQGAVTVSPKLVSIEKWMVVGPFDLGTQKTPSGGPKLDKAPPAFVQPLEPEENCETTRTYTSGQKTVTWQEVETGKNGVVDFNGIYGGNFALAYGLCHIKAPDDRKVLAAFRGNDLSKIFVNDLEVYSSGYFKELKYFMLPLSAGWNTVIVKCADYTSGWGYTLRVAPDEELEISTAK